MVKGVSRQVIVLRSPDQKLFEQAIFILKDGQEGVSDEALLKEAKRIANIPRQARPWLNLLAGPVWALGGAAVTVGVWAIVSLF